MARQFRLSVMENKNASYDLAANFVTKPEHMEKYTKASLQLLMTGSPVGTFTMEKTDQADPGEDFSSAGWEPMNFENEATGLLLTLPATGAPDYYLKWVADMQWVRLKYTFSSGTGSVALHGVGKDGL